VAMVDVIGLGSCTMVRSGNIVFHISGSSVTVSVSVSYTSTRYIIVQTFL